VRTQALGVASYRFRATFGRRLAGYLAVVLLVGLLGGLSMAALAGARQTESSFSRFYASTNPSNLDGGIAVFNPSAGSAYDSGYSASRVATLAHLPLVENVGVDVGLNMGPVTPDGEPVPSSAGVGVDGSLNGEYFTQDRIFVTAGRLPDPARADEFAMDSQTAAAEGLHLGELVTMGIYTNREIADDPNISARSGPKPYRTLRMRLVGVGAIEASSAVEDDVDAQSGSLVLMTPALTKRYAACCSSSSSAYLRLDGGNRSAARVEAEITQAFPGLPASFLTHSGIVAKANRSITPEAVALGAFGIIAALALLVIAEQVISRQLRLNADDLVVLRAIGADPSTTVSDGLAGVLVAITAGGLLAVLVALGLSPLAPIGPVRPYLAVGIHADWLVLALGLASLIVVLGALALAIAIREAPHRAALRGARRQPGPSAANALAAAGLPASVVAGVRFALEPGGGRQSVPVRAAIFGAVLAVLVVSAATVFGSSLNSLVSHPALYGWNWTYEINGGDALGDIPNDQGQATRLLDADRFVGSWTGVYFSSLSIDGQQIAVMGVSPNAPIGPPILSGHGLQAADQVVLGSQTLAQLHKQVGDTVEVRAGKGRPSTLRIVGTATLPAIGVGGGLHLEIGSGAVLPYRLIPAFSRNIFDVTPGPNAILVRDRAGVNPAAARRSLEQIGRRLQIAFNGGAVDGVERPAEIINYRSLGTTPEILGGGLAAGATIALGLTLLASVRRRRRDLALLKTLGFTERQLAATVACQSLVAVGVGTVVGLPLGVVFGRVLWNLFAGQVHFVPQPTVSAWSVVLVAAGALVLACVVAWVPARLAARTETTVLLRAE
jgi:MacB-like periplasmic core domain/FtsX-like permease family